MRFKYRNRLFMSARFLHACTSLVYGVYQKSCVYKQAFTVAAQNVLKQGCRYVHQSVHNGCTNFQQQQKLKHRAQNSHRLT